MRIRQVRPEFFSDPVVAKLSPDVRLTYIGLWCVADDAGYLVWDPPHIAALLSPYESIRAREKRVEKSGLALREAGRLVFYDCSCVLIPRLEEHQRIGGNKSYLIRDKHAVHMRMDRSGRRASRQDPENVGKSDNGAEVHTDMDESARNVTVGNVTVVAPASADALARLRDQEDAAEVAAVTARRGGLRAAG